MSESPIGDNRLRASGDLSSGSARMVTAPVLREQLHTQVQRGNLDVVVDLSGVDLIDSSGLSALISGLKAARQAGGSLRIARPSKQARSILKLTNLHRVFEPMTGRTAPSVSQPERRQAFDTVTGPQTPTEFGAASNELWTDHARFRTTSAWM